MEHRQIQEVIKIRSLKGRVEHNPSIELSHLHIIIPNSLLPLLPCIALCPGRLILQDREPVIAGVVAESRNQGLPFEAQVHDFTPQPIHGARAYYLNSVLHDWSDNECAQIFSRI